MTAATERPLHGAALDAEIRRVEQALIDREARFVSGTRALGQRVQHALPRSWGAAGLGLLGWMLRPSSRGSHAGSGSGSGAAAPVATSSWGRMLAMAWPLVPAAWKARIDPRTLTLVTAVGLPLAERLLARRRRPPRTAPYVDLHRYAGDWFEIARLPESHESSCAGDVTASYVPRDRSRFTVVNRCLDTEGGAKQALGVAEVVRGGHGAKLRVNFAPTWVRRLGFAWANYWILRVDRDYDTALVGTPDRKHLWLLSRTPAVDPETYRRMMDYARIEGYDTDRVSMTRQSEAEADARREAETRAARRREQRAATAHATA